MRRRFEAASWSILRKKAGLGGVCYGDPAQPTLSGSFTIVAQLKCNYRAEVTGVECKRFRVGHAPKRHAVFCGSRGPKRPTAQRPAISPTQRQSELSTLATALPCSFAKLYISLGDLTLFDMLR